MILDDVDARPGSVTSLLRTIVGVGLRQVGGWISIADLIRLMDVLGVSGVQTRTAVSRVKAKGLLLPSARSGQSGYALNPDAVPMLERGDRRIFTFRQMADGDPWCLLSFSIPETQRDARHQLRKRLGWIGCGTVATGLWICPAFLADEVEEIVDDLGLRGQTTLFITETPRIRGSLADAAARWWDLDRLADLHRAFTASQSALSPEGTAWRPSRRGSAGPVFREGAAERSSRGGPAESSSRSGTSRDPDPRASFARFIRALDEWRILPYLDPGLPPSALPADWPGFESVAVFERVTADHAALARGFLREMCAVV